MEDILKNINALEESIRLSHHTERMIFLSEIQLQIDKHCLEFELDKEKFKSERLKRLNKADDSHDLLLKDNKNEVKMLKTKCQELTTIIKRRSNQLFKALAQIKDLKTDKEKLSSKIKAQNAKIKHIHKKYEEKLNKMEQELDRCREELVNARQAFFQSDAQVALQEQMRRNKLLMYTNCQLKTQIAYSKRVEKFNVSTQVYFGDFYNKSSDNEISG